MTSVADDASVRGLPDRLPVGTRLLMCSIVLLVSPAVPEVKLKVNGGAADAKARSATLFTISHNAGSPDSSFGPDGQPPRPNRTAGTAANTLSKPAQFPHVVLP